MVKRKKYLEMREFLNKDLQMTAYVRSKVFSDRACVEADFELADCIRSVTLDFFCTGEENTEAALHKVELLYKAISDFRRNLKRAIKDRSGQED